MYFANNCKKVLLKYLTVKNPIFSLDFQANKYTPELAFILNIQKFEQSLQKLL